MRTNEDDSEFSITDYKTWEPGHWIGITYLAGLFIVSVALSLLTSVAWGGFLFGVGLIIMAIAILVAINN
jgi:hypothetical protein